MSRNRSNRSKGIAITPDRHQDARVNIPTEELRDFLADDERAPKTMLYPRDPSLDPQLVWKGKDDQDREDLGVPIVPLAPGLLVWDFNAEFLLDGHDQLDRVQAQAYVDGCYCMA